VQKLICFYLVLFLNIANSGEKRVNTEKKVTHSNPQVPLEWVDLLDPKTKKFWREGRHEPDEGFVLFAQNPESIKHAKLWLLRMETKAKILVKMQKTVDKAQLELFKEGLIEDRYWQFSDIKKGKLANRLPIKELEKLQVYFLFSSTCPSCHKLAKKLDKFKRVSPLQVDQKGLIDFANLPKTQRATNQTIQTYVKDGIVPVVVLHKVGSNSVMRLVGNNDQNTYMQAAMKLLNGREAI
jgi:hypothetical protein